MAFKEVTDLGCDKAIQLGGVDKKTKKPNPKQLEGYYLGSRQIPSTKSKSGFTNLHVFQTVQGNVGVWGKTDLDSKLAGAAKGTMTRITFTGMVETKNNPMYKYKVETDEDNVIDVATAETGDAAEDQPDVYPGDAPPHQEDDVEETPLDGESDIEDTIPPVRASAPKKAALPPSADSQARVKALLNRNKTV